MRPRAWRAGLTIAAWLFPLGSPLTAQTEGTLGLGGTLVRYDGFLASGAAVFAPALRFDSPRLSFSGVGSWTVFESGRGVLTASAAAAWLAGSSGSWRLELSGSTGASGYAEEAATGHLLAGARLHVFGTSTGGWIGVNAGGSFGGSGGAPVEVVIAGWSQRNRLALVGSVTTTWQGRVRHLDLVGAVRWTSPGIELEARAGARPWVQNPQAVSVARAEAFGEITAVVPLSQRLAISFGGGKSPSDPVRQVLGAAYLSAGLRWRAFGRQARSMPVHTTSVLRGRRVPSDERGPLLEIAGSAERRTLRVHAANSNSVELMADFTDWVAVRLVQVAPSVWEISLAVPAGVHRVNIRLDGGPWSAPGGTRLEQTEFGGAVGIVVVP